MDTNEIVREIAEVIRLGNPAAAGCEVEISDMIGQLQRPHSPAFGYRKNNKKYAADIIKWIEEGQRLLRGRPDTIHPALLFRQMGLHDWGNLLFFGETKSLQRLIDTLDSIRRHCIVIGEVGAHGNAGHDQERVPMSAFGGIADIAQTSENVCL